jgi:pimeloyl-ACP methyl ester carboxylesterase
VVDRPRLLLIPQLTELEWLIKPELETWADVAAYDAPGVGEEPAVADFGSRAVAKRGLEELERRGWERCVVVVDEFGAVAAAHLASMRPDVIEAVAFGHARLSNSIEGERAPINREILAAVNQLARHDRRTFVRQFFRLTQGEQLSGGYGEELVEAYLDRVPGDLMIFFFETRLEAGDVIEPSLRSLEVPFLFAKHDGCLMFTDEGYADALAAFPEASAVEVMEKPSASPDFARAVQELWQRLPGRQRATGPSEA